MKEINDDELNKKTKEENKMFKKKTFNVAITLVSCLVFVLFLGIAFNNNSNADASNYLGKKSRVLDKEKRALGLNYVQSNEEFMKLLSDYANGQMVKNEKEMGGGNRELTNQDSVVEKSSAPVSESTNDLSGAYDADIADTTSSKDFSKTNTQVEGVDEADIVKTDGKYIYYVANGNVYIVKSNFKTKDGKKSILSTLTFKEFWPTDMFVDGNKLIVLGQSYEQGEETLSEQERSTLDNDKAKAEILPYYPQKSFVKVIVYDITNRADVKELKTVQIEGSYVTARKVGNDLYFVSNKYMNYMGICAPYAREAVIYEDKEVKEATDAAVTSSEAVEITPEQMDQILPLYQDSTVTDACITIDPTDILVPDKITDDSYMIIAGINLDKLNEEVNLTTILGVANNVYMSNKNLYVAKVNYEYPEVNTTTQVYRLALDSGKATIKASNSVKGSVINQFSMDEHFKYFRIATTVGNVWDEKNPSTNDVYVLDMDMNVIGSVTGLAKGESIHSTRFMGDKLYMVTFKTVDPFFVVDLSNPTAPKVLGELKIPGYSEYLHPYDETHVIGIGMDTKTMKLDDGNEVTKNAGMKVAMFDVSDFSNPTLLHEIKVGDTGTYSEALYNHKAVLFSKEKNLLALPISVYKIDSKNQEYGKIDYVGAMVFDISVEKGITIRGKVTHFKNNASEEQFWQEYNKTINRVMYIENKLYSFSNQYIYASDLKTLKTLEKLEFDIPENTNMINPITY